MTKKIILIIIITGIIIFTIYQGFLKKEKPDYSLLKVSLGTVVQEVSETGTVKKGEKIDLSFKNTGRIENVYVKVGDEVKEGDILLELDTSELEKQILSARASLEAKQAELNKTLAGATEEEIRVLETALENAKISLENAQKNLEDVKTTAITNLNKDYQDAQDAVNTAYLYFISSFYTLNDLYDDSTLRAVFSIKNSQVKNDALNDWEEVKKEKTEIKNYIDLMNDDPSRQNIDTALRELNSSLNILYNCLNLTEEGLYATVTGVGGLTSTQLNSYKSDVSSAKSDIQTQISNLNDAQQTILTTKDTNQSNINTAEAKVNIDQGKVKTAEDNLALKKAPPREVDLATLHAQLKQAQAEVSLLQNKIKEVVLKSPAQGKIIEINKKVGEIVQPMLAGSVISILPAVPFEIKVDIYEEDVVKTKIGNLVDITLVAFPNQTFKGRVVNIDPAEKLIDEVVYYEVTIGFEETIEGIKPGMSADVVIKTASKENILVIPEEAIRTKDDKTIVQILKDGEIENREIEIGLKGSNDLVEVVSGLEEGEEVIIAP